MRPRIASTSRTPLYGRCSLGKFAPEGPSHGDQATRDGITHNVVDESVRGNVFQVGKLVGNIGLPAESRAVINPQQIPLSSARFTGRGDELAWISRLRSDQVAGNTRAPVVIAIDGMAGVGKTSLATHWAHAECASFPDGCFYLNLRGFDPNLPALESRDAINVLLDSLGVAARDMPQTYTSQEALYRSLLASREVLMVLDNARSVEQIRPLLPTHPKSMVLITSRLELSALISHFGATLVKLQPLSVEESQELLMAHLGPDRVESDRAATEDIANSCARLPLALSIVAARAATRPAFRLSDIASELRDQSSRLDYLDLGEIDSNVRTVFSWSFSALSADAALVLSLIGSFPGPDISLLAVASLASLPVTGAQICISELTRANLVEEYSPRRYRLHDLLRAYAVERGRSVHPDLRAAAIRRLLDHYTCSSIAADRLLDPPRRQISYDPPGVDVQVHPMDAYVDALAWFDQEHHNIVSAAQISAEEKQYDYTWRLAWAANTYFYWRAQWNDIVLMHRLGVEAARSLGDLAAEAHMQRGLGRALARLNLFDEASNCQAKALELCTVLDDKVGQATTHHALSFLLDKQGEFADALTHAEAALPLWRAIGNPAREARALCDLGWAHFRAGSHETALRECQAALTMFDELHNLHGKTLVLNNISKIFFAGGSLSAAAAHAEQQISLEAELGNRNSEAAAYDLLGDIREAQGQHETALEAWMISYRIFDQESRPEAREVQRKLDTRRSPHGGP